MSWNISVLTPNGRRCAAKFASDATLLQVLEHACKKQSFEAEEYDLTHHNKPLDTSLTLRFSGLPNNASLEMAPVKKARVDSEVILGLQLENGSRLMGTFKPSTTIFDVITSMAPDQSDASSNPVVIYMRKEIFGSDALQATTLKNLGLTGGRAILRLIHRTPEQLQNRFQANVSAPLPQKPKEDAYDYEPAKNNLCANRPESSVTANIIKTLKNETQVGQNLVKDNAIDEETTSSIDFKRTMNMAPKRINEPVREESSVNDAGSSSKVDENDLSKDIIFLGERNALVFSQEMINDFVQFEDLPDDFYELTLDEVKKLLIDLRKKREQMENAPLQTNAIRTAKQDEQTTKKIRKNEKVVLRILFPDRTVLQGTFVPVDKIQVVKNFVKSYLENSNEDFDLYVSPPKKILSADLSLLEAECIPSAILHFGPHNRDTTNSSNTKYLKANILSKLTSPQAAAFSVTLARNQLGNKDHLEMQVDP